MRRSIGVEMKHMTANRRLRENTHLFHLVRTPIYRNARDIHTYKIKDGKWEPLSTNLLSDATQDAKSIRSAQKMSTRV